MMTIHAWQIRKVTPDLGDLSGLLSAEKGEPERK